MKEDPSGTTLIVNAFAAEIFRRLDVATAAILRELDNDLSNHRLLSITDLIANVDEKYSPALIQDLVDMIEENVESGLLYVEQEGERWSDFFVGRAYQKGKERVSVQFKMEPTSAEGILSASGMMTGAHFDTLASLYIQVYNEIKGFTADTSKRLARELTLGMAQGLSPRKIGENLRKVIDITKRRALLIARTEVIRAHHRAMVQQLRGTGIYRVKVIAEWVTAGDDKVCPRCEAHDGKTFTLDEVEFMIPVHSNCRCVIAPISVA